MVQEPNHKRCRTQRRRPAGNTHKSRECLSDNGEIVYSTCSLEPEEDELNIDWAIRALDLEIQPVGDIGQAGLTKVFGKQLDPMVACCRRFWPDQTQGFFAANSKRGVSMKAKVITNFAATFEIDIGLNPDLIMEKSGRYYLVNARLNRLLNRNSTTQVCIWARLKRANSSQALTCCLCLLRRMPTALFWIGRLRGCLSAAETSWLRVLCVFSVQERNIRTCWFLTNSVNV